MGAVVGVPVGFVVPAGVVGRGAAEDARVDDEVAVAVVRLVVVGVDIERALAPAEIALVKQCFHAVRHLVLFADFRRSRAVVGLEPAEQTRPVDCAQGILDETRRGLNTNEFVVEFILEIAEFPGSPMTVMAHDAVGRSHALVCCHRFLTPIGDADRVDACAHQEHRVVRGLAVGRGELLTGQLTQSDFAV